MKKIITALVIINLFTFATAPVLSADSGISVVVKHDDNKKKNKKNKKEACCSSNDKSATQSSCGDKNEGKSEKNTSAEKPKEGAVKSCCSKEASQTKSCH